MCYGPGDIIDPTGSPGAGFTMVFQLHQQLQNIRFLFQSGSIDDIEINEQEPMPSGQMDSLLKMLQTQGKQMEEILRNQQQMKASLYPGIGTVLETCKLYQADQAELWQQLKANKAEEKKPRKKRHAFLM